MHTLPKLKYSFNSLEPYIDSKTMETHYTKHHQAYIDNLNKTIEPLPDFNNMPIEKLLQNVSQLPEDSKQMVVNNGGGHFNHSFFWDILSPTKKEFKGKIKELIERTFGSLENFKSKFSEVALKRFGSGWAWLVINKENNPELYSTPNQDSPIMQNHLPIIGLDVWEHAYYLKYQNRRAEYIEAFWNIIDWDSINSNL